MMMIMIINFIIDETFYTFDIYICKRAVYYVYYIKHLIYKNIRYALYLLYIYDGNVAFT